jgi:hypothetical protein
MRIVALIGVLAAAPACSDECRDGESICDGTHIRACGPPGDFGGVRAFNSLEDGCGDAMCLDLTADGNRVALCSSSGQPDPRCDGQVGGFCYDAQTKLYCDLGYSHELRCEGACVRDDQKHILFCSIEPKPNLICDDTDPVACDGQSVVSCVDHYVVDRIACPASCVGTNNRAYCTDGSTCSAGDQATCDDPNDPVGAIHGCIAGQGVAMSCNSSSQCENDAVVVGETVGATEAECVHRDP